MALSPELLELCLKEFPTFDAAVSNPMAKGFARIEWRELRRQDMRFPRISESPEVEVLPVDKRFITLQALPSGEFIWVPDHPEDLNTVMKHKANQPDQASKVLTIVRQIPISDPASTANSRQVEVEKTLMKRELSKNFLEVIETDRKYEIKLFWREGITSSFPDLSPIYLISGVLYYRAVPQASLF